MESRQLGVIAGEAHNLPLFSTSGLSSNSHSTNRQQSGATPEQLNEIHGPVGSSSIIGRASQFTFPTVNIRTGEHSASGNQGSSSSSPVVLLQGKHHLPCICLYLFSLSFIIMLQVTRIRMGDDLYVTETAVLANELNFFQVDLKVSFALFSETFHIAGFFFPRSTTGCA